MCLINFWINTLMEASNRNVWEEKKPQNICHQIWANRMFESAWDLEVFLEVMRTETFKWGFRLFIAWIFSMNFINTPHESVSLPHSYICWTERTYASYRWIDVSIAKILSSGLRVTISVWFFSWLDTSHKDLSKLLYTCLFEVITKRKLLDTGMSLQHP